MVKYSYTLLHRLILDAFVWTYRQCINMELGMLKNFNTNIQSTLCVIVSVYKKHTWCLCIYTYMKQYDDARVLNCIYHKFYGLPTSKGFQYRRHIRYIDITFPVTKVEIAVHFNIDHGFHLVIVSWFTVRIQFRSILHSLVWTKHGNSKVFQISWQLYHLNTYPFSMVKIKKVWLCIWNEQNIKIYIYIHMINRRVAYRTFKNQSWDQRLNIPTYCRCLAL